MAALTYEELMAGGSGDPFDRHVFASVVALALSDDTRPLTQSLGLDGWTYRRLAGTFFPRIEGLASRVGVTATAGEDALEEPDLRQLLLDHGRAGAVEETWLAAIIARRSLAPNHLWQDLGLPGRTDLGRLLHRHFPVLAALNDRDMKWKKFFYRQLCHRDGVLVCKAPNCSVCPETDVCFAEERGEPLLALR